MSERSIMHVDMNAFFASVEQQANPALQGKPVGVTGAAGRTVITTASYEARALGVRTGMAVGEAKRVCPELILVMGDNRKYTSTSRKIIAILREFTPMVEVFSIDEAFLDVTGSRKLFGSPEEIALQIKERIRSELGLTCSIGIAPNKLLAKLASDMKKPDGLTIITPENALAILERLPVREMFGIGGKTAQQLALLGIRTCGELGRFPVALLHKKFGVNGDRLHQIAKGIDNSPVVPEEEAEEVKSVGHSTTLDRDITDHAEIERWLLQLSEMVGRRARRYKVWGKTVTLTVRYADFTTFSRQETQPRHTNSSDEIYHAALKILNELTLEQPVRLLGVTITNLCYQTNQLPLFEEERRKTRATEAMDMVNGRFGDFTVTFGSLIGEENKGAKVISPAWKPEGIRNVEVK